MAYGIVHFFPDGTKEQYEANLVAVHPGPDQLPDGQTFHAAGPSLGWLDDLGGARLEGELGAVPRRHPGMPRMQQGIQGGFQPPPQETAIDLYKVLP